MKMTDLLIELKKSIGIIAEDNSLDDFYISKLNIAKIDLQSEDISEAVLDSEIGHTTIILYAELLLEQKDIASNPTLTFLRNKLSLITKGERISE